MSNAKWYVWVFFYCSFLAISGMLCLHNFILLIQKAALNLAPLKADKFFIKYQKVFNFSFTWVLFVSYQQFTELEKNWGFYYAIVEYSTLILAYLKVILQLLRQTGIINKFI